LLFGLAALRDLKLGGLARPVASVLKLATPRQVTVFLSGNYIHGL
jgi:hypothetical protein